MEKKLTAEMVAADRWFTMPDNLRGAACALARLSDPDILSRREWYELTRAQRAALVPEVCAMVYAHAERMLAEAKESRLFVH